MKKQIYTLNGRGKGSLNNLVAQQLYLLVDTATTAAIPLGGTVEGSPVTGPIVTQVITAFVSEGQMRIGSSPIKDLEQALSAYFVSLISGEIAVAGIYASNSTKVGAITVEIDFNEPGVRVYVNLPSYSKGIVGRYDFSANYVPFSFVQKTYSDKQHSYFTTETLTGGTWIDGKPIYRIVFSGLESVAGTAIANIPDIETIIPGTLATYRTHDPLDSPVSQSNYDLGTGNLTLSMQYDGFFNLVIEYTKNNSLICKT